MCRRVVISELSARPPLKTGSAKRNVAMGSGWPWVLKWPVSEKGPAPAGKNQVGIWIIAIFANITALQRILDVRRQARSTNKYHFKG